MTPNQTILNSESFRSRSFLFSFGVSSRSTVMKAVASGLWLMLMAAFASAGDTLVDGGRSPDGRYEVRIARHTSPDANGVPDTYSIHLHAAKTATPFFTLDSIGGYNRYAAATERCRAFWHQSGRFVVITDQATRHSREIYVLAVSDGRAERLQFPDYVQNALGRVDATEIDLHCVSTPKRWDGDDLLLALYFSVRTPERGRLFYTCDVTLHLSHGAHMAPSIGLKNVSIPTPGNS